MLDDGDRLLREQIRSLLPMVITGFVLVLLALMVLLWPNGQFGDEGVITMPHVTRIFSTMLNETGVNIARRILDLGIYVVVAVGLVLLVTAWRGGKRGAVLGLMVVSIMGLSYVGGMALYTGPMIGTCGFMLILFGGLVTWASTSDHIPEVPVDSNDEKYFTTDPIHTLPIDTLGTDENATHPVT